MIQLGFTQLGYWAKVMTAIGRGDLATDPRFADPAALHANRVEAIASLDKEFASRTCAEWVENLSVFDRGWEVVQKGIEVCDDPQVTANDYIAYLDRSGELTPIVRNPVQFDESVPEIHRAPEAGEQTDEILGELGLGWNAIVDLKVTGAVL